MLPWRKTAKGWLKYGALSCALFAFLIFLPVWDLKSKDGQRIAGTSWMDSFSSSVHDRKVSLFKRYYYGGSFNADNVGQYNTLNKVKYFDIWAIGASVVRVALRNGKSYIPLAAFSQGNYADVTSYYAPLFVYEAMLGLIFLFSLLSGCLICLGLPQYKAKEHNNLAQTATWINLLVLLLLIWLSSITNIFGGQYLATSMGYFHSSLKSLFSTTDDMIATVPSNVNATIDLLGGYFNQTANTLSNSVSADTFNQNVVPPLNIFSSAMASACASVSAVSTLAPQASTTGDSFVTAYTSFTNAAAYLSSAYSTLTANRISVTNSGFYVSITSTVSFSPLPTTQSITSAANAAPTNAPQSLAGMLGSNPTSYCTAVQTSVPTIAPNAAIQIKKGNAQLQLVLAPVIKLAKSSVSSSLLNMSAQTNSSSANWQSLFDSYYNSYRFFETFRLPVHLTLLIIICILPVAVFILAYLKQPALLHRLTYINVPFACIIVCLALVVLPGSVFVGDMCNVAFGSEPSNLGKELQYYNSSVNIFTEMRNLCLSNYSLYEVAIMLNQVNTSTGDISVVVNGQLTAADWTSSISTVSSAWTTSLFLPISDPTPSINPISSQDLSSLSFTGLDNLVNTYLPLYSSTGTTALNSLQGISSSITASQLVFTDASSVVIASPSASQQTAGLTAYKNQLNNIISAMQTLVLPGGSVINQLSVDAANLATSISVLVTAATDAKTNAALSLSSYSTASSATATFVQNAKTNYTQSLPNTISNLNASFQTNIQSAISSLGSSLNCQSIGVESYNAQNAVCKGSLMSLDLLAASFVILALSCAFSILFYRRVARILADEFIDPTFERELTKLSSIWAAKTAENNDYRTKIMSYIQDDEKKWLEKSKTGSTNRNSSTSNARWSAITEHGASHRSSIASSPAASALSSKLSSPSKPQAKSPISQYEPSRKEFGEFSISPTSPTSSASPFSPVSFLDSPESPLSFETPNQTPIKNEPEKKHEIPKISVSHVELSALAIPRGQSKMVSIDETVDELRSPRSLVTAQALTSSTTKKEDTGDMTQGNLCPRVPSYLNMISFDDYDSAFPEQIQREGAFPPVYINTSRVEAFFGDSEALPIFKPETFSLINSSSVEIPSNTSTTANASAPLNVSSPSLAPAPPKRGPNSVSSLTSPSLSQSLFKKESPSVATAPPIIPPSPSKIGLSQSNSASPVVQGSPSVRSLAMQPPAIPPSPSSLSIKSAFVVSPPVPLSPVKRGLIANLSPILEASQPLTIKPKSLEPINANAASKNTVYRGSILAEIETLSRKENQDANMLTGPFNLPPLSESKELGDTLSYNIQSEKPALDINLKAPQRPEFEKLDSLELTLPEVLDLPPLLSMSHSDQKMEDWMRMIMSTPESQKNDLTQMSKSMKSLEAAIEMKVPVISRSNTFKSDIPIHHVSKSSVKLDPIEITGSVKPVEVLMTMAPVKLTDLPVMKGSPMSSRSGSAKLPQVKSTLVSALENSHSSQSSLTKLTLLPSIGTTSAVTEIINDSSIKTTIPRLSDKKPKKHIANLKIIVASIPAIDVGNENAKPDVIIIPEPLDEPTSASSRQVFKQIEKAKSMGFSVAPKSSVLKTAIKKEDIIPRDQPMDALASMLETEDQPTSKSSRQFFQQIDKIISTIPTEVPKSSLLPMHSKTAMLGLDAALKTMEGHLEGGLMPAPKSPALIIPKISKSGAQKMQQLYENDFIEPVSPFASQKDMEITNESKVKMKSETSSLKSSLSAKILMIDERKDNVDTQVFQPQSGEAKLMVEMSDTADKDGSSMSNSSGKSMADIVKARLQGENLPAINSNRRRGSNGVISRNPKNKSKPKIDFENDFPAESLNMTLEFKKKTVPVKIKFIKGCRDHSPHLEYIMDEMKLDQRFALSPEIIDDLKNRLGKASAYIGILTIRQHGPSEDKIFGGMLSYFEKNDSGASCSFKSTRVSLIPQNKVNWIQQYLHTEAREVVRQMQKEFFWVIIQKD